MVGKDGREEVEAGAEAKLGDLEAVAEAVGQAVAGKEDVARLGEATGEREVGVVEAGGDRDHAVAPVQFGVVGLCHRG